MGVVVDTSVLVGAERGRFRFPELLRAVEGEPALVSAITASELLHGAHRAIDPVIQARRFAWAESVLEQMPILDFGILEARRHADLWAQLVRSGSMIGAHDLVIAATCVARGHALATLNERDFSRVPGLRLVPTAGFLA